MTSIPNNRIAIIDFGSQYTQLIARRLRNLGCYCEIFSSQIHPGQLFAWQPKGVILSGGPNSVSTNNDLSGGILELECPILGICYGMQALVASLGGTVATTEKAEYGKTPLIELVSHHPLFLGLTDNTSVWMSHGDSITVLPDDFKILAMTHNQIPAAITHQSKPIYGLQFHPEVTHTDQGQQILENFLDICHIQRDWCAQDIKSSLLEDVKQQVGEDKVLLALSGGVDSSVLALLLSQAIPQQLQCIFVNNGLLRRGETSAVMQTLSELGVPIQEVDAQDKFLGALV